METIVYLIPIITIAILAIFYRKETVWWEYLIVIVPTMLIYFTIRGIALFTSSLSTEYYGGYITKIIHYDDWDEWIVKTCTRQVFAGTDSKGRAKYRTETYDCSYREYYPDYWVMKDNNGSEIYISQHEFDSIKASWGTPEVFLDMHRDYMTIDGDAQYHEWNNEKETIRTVSTAHSYRNKVKNSLSVFNFREISKKEAEKLGLFDYPKIKNYDQNPILGLRGCTENDIREISYLNGVYGKDKQFRMYLMFFYNKDLQVSIDQQSYWVGGNKNEFNVCIGLDSLTNKIQWVNAFSWMDKPTLEVNVESYFNSRDTVDIKEFSEYINRLIPSQWERKEFKDFEYLKSELNSTAYTVIIILLFLYNIGISIFVIKNDFKND